MPRTMPMLIAGALSLTVLSAVPAEAASNKVTIKPIASKTVPYKKSTTIKPRVTTSGKVKVSSKTLTVKKGRKTLAKKNKSVKLKAGKYQVTQTVKYRTYKMAPTNVLAISRGDELPSWENDGGIWWTRCTVTGVWGVEDYTLTCALVGATVSEVELHSGDFFTYEENLQIGDDIRPYSTYSPVDIYQRRSAPLYGKTHTKTKTQSLTIKQGKKPRGCATKSAYNRVKYGDSKSTVTSKMGTSGKVFYDAGGYQGREYKTCDRSQYMSVSFKDGYVYDKLFADFG